MSATTTALRRTRLATPSKIKINGESFSFLLLFASLTYGMIGIPVFDRDITLDTNYVSPLNRWIWIGLLAAAAPLLKQHWRDTIILARRSLPLLLLFFYFALTTTWALDSGASERRLIYTLLQFLLLIIVMSALRQPNSVQVAVAAACLTIALGDVVTWVVNPEYAMTSEGFAGFQTQKNQTGLMMMYGCLAAGTGTWQASNRRTRLVWAVTFLIMLAILVLSRSTTSQTVVLATPMLLATVIVLGRLSDRGLTAVFTTAFVSLATIVFVYFAACAVIGRDPWLPMRGITFTDRLDLWQFVVKEIWKRPWFGAGYCSFWAIDPAVQPSLKQIDWYAIYTIINEGHDGYLDLLATTGVFGFVGGLFVVFQSTGKAFRAVQRNTMVGLPRGPALFHMSFLLGLLIHNFTESNLFCNQGILAMALMLCVLDLNKWHVQMPTSRRNGRR